ncbi:hypothetical protein FRC17_000473 [Serendipita sp. 399]|nr:hypothetical protein FRC17_000473 [Serendipita sp. 399]
MALFRSMKVGRIGSHITIFRICLRNDDHCRYCSEGHKGNLRGVAIKIADYCRCHELDKQLGSALVELPNLRVLTFSCRLVHRKGKERHAWLAKLKTKDLQELEIGCGFLQWKVEDYNRLLAPCMQKLTAVKLDSGFPVEDSQLKHLMPLCHEFFPSLHTFVYHSPDTSTLRDSILSDRPIKNLICIPGNDPYSTWWAPNITRLLKDGPSRLEMLYAPAVSRWLPLEDPSPYLNLTSLGTINFSAIDSASGRFQSTPPIADIHSRKKR